MTKAEQILESMTLEQKIAQLQCALSFGTKIDSEQCPDGLGEVGLLAGVGKEQLAEMIAECSDEIAAKSKGVHPIFHLETLTGVSIAEADVFPSAIGLGASFDPEVVEKSVQIIHNQAKAVGVNQALSPVLDVCRDPRWGRIGETYGEDPTLNAMIGTAFVKALQGEEGDKMCATGKHFLGYGFSSGGINMATCMASMREIREVYAKPFQAAISEADLMSIMNSYGTIDGEMVIGSEKIMTDLLRNELEFDGMVVSDYASIEHLLDHRLATDTVEAGLQALKAGLDVECPQPVGYKTADLVNAVKTGKLEESYIDRAVLRILKVKEKLGLIGDEYKKGIESKDRQKAFSDENIQKQCLETAQKTIVMLKNDGILPLEKNKKKVAVIGPHADNKRLLFGCYTFAAGTDMMIGGSLSDQAGMESSLDDMAKAMDVQKGIPKYEGSTVEKSNEEALKAVEAIYPDTKTVLASIKDKNLNVEVSYIKGCDIAGYDRSEFNSAIKLAEESDVVIMTLGGKYGWGGSCTIGEGIDTDDIGLPGVQEELALKVIGIGKPTIIVHMDARPLSSAALEEKANAILECWFPGTIGGLAIADVLFGDYNPAGRLPVTVARSAGQIPIYCGQYTGNSYYSDATPTVSARYVDSTTRPLYYFGHGLSYTEFAYSDLKIDGANVAPDGEVKISCKIKNIGEKDGEEVAQLYVSDLMASMLRPYKEFAGCKRVFLKAGEEKEVEFTVRADQFAFIGKNDRWIVEEGDMQVMIGGSSEKLELSGQFHITETVEIRPAHRGFYAKAKIK